MYMGLDIFCNLVVEILPYCGPTNELHVLEVEKVYWKYIVNVLIDSIMDYLKEIISIKIKFHRTHCILNRKSYIESNIGS